MINDYNKLSEQERTKAIKLYQQSIKNKMIASILTPLQNELTDFCKENDLMIDGPQQLFLTSFNKIIRITQLLFVPTLILKPKAKSILLNQQKNY